MYTAAIHVSNSSSRRDTNVVRFAAFLLGMIDRH
jgi:hypothetical protein